MNSPIKTNQLVYSLQHEQIDRRYDIFSVKTTDKYFKSGAYIIDAPILEKNVCAIRFLSGKSFLVLMRKSTENKQLLKKALSKAEGSDCITVVSVPSSSLSDDVLLQLLFNSLGSVEHPFLRFNNLTGHLYCFHPKWVRSSKKDNTIWQVPCLEIKISPECRLLFEVKTFTSELLRNKITFKKRKFEDYPKYVFSVRNTLRRNLKEDKETAFIQRQIDGEKTSLDFMSLRSYEDFDKTKMGIVAAIVTRFNETMEGLAHVDFAEITEYHSLDYDLHTKKENAARITQYLSEKQLRIVDMIDDVYSQEFCKKMQALLLEKYNITVSIGKRVLKKHLNLCLIHNASYYLDGNDPHQKQYPDAAVQHITFEDFGDHAEYAISTVVHELLIKTDLQEQRIRLFDWEKLGLQEDISFGMMAENETTERYFFMQIHPDGRFSISEQELDLFEERQFSRCVQIFADAKSNSETIKGLIRDHNGNINIIKDTGWVTIPELFRIREELKNGNTALRGKQMREELLSASIDIKQFHDGNSTFYFVGTIGAGMKYTLHNAVNIRRIEPYEDAPMMFDNLLTLMNVTFVRNGQLTVLPFPFKYLREHILSLGLDTN